MNASAHTLTMLPVVRLHGKAAETTFTGTCSCGWRLRGDIYATYTRKQVRDIHATHSDAVLSQERAS